MSMKKYIHKNNVAITPKIEQLASFLSYLCNISHDNAFSCPSHTPICPFQNKSCDEISHSDWIEFISKQHKKEIYGLVPDRKCAMSKSISCFTNKKHNTCVKHANNDICPLHRDDCENVEYSDWINWLEDINAE